MPKDKRIQLSNQSGLRVSIADLSCPKANTQPSLRWISAVITPMWARHRLSRRNQIIALAPRGRTFLVLAVCRKHQHHRSHPHALDLAGDRLVCAAFSPDAKLVATGSMDNLIRLMDAATGQVVRVLRGQSSYVYAIAFSSDGSSLVSGGKDQATRLWNTATGQQIARLDSDTQKPQNSWSAAFSPDGKYLATASGDGSVKLWECPSQRLLRTLRGHTEIVSAIAFFPDSQRLVTGSYDASIRLWDVATGKELRKLGQADRVQRAVFSPDGKRLVTGGVDGTVKLWDMITGQELITLEHHADGISSIAFTRDGMSLAATSMDGTVNLPRAAGEGPGSVGFAAIDIRE